MQEQVKNLVQRMPLSAYAGQVQAMVLLQKIPFASIGDVACTSANDWCRCNWEYCNNSPSPYQNGSVVMVAWVGSLQPNALHPRLVVVLAQWFLQCHCLVVVSAQTEIPPQISNARWLDVDQPVYWCLDTLHTHRLRCKDRPYGGKLSKDIDRISSLFY